MFTVDSMIAAGIGATQARQMFTPLSQACGLFDINTLNRQAAFIAQTAYESALFTKLEEDLYYTNAVRIMRIFPNEVTSLVQANTLVGNRAGLANTVYAGKNGNGNYASGDGFKYHGRGLIQLTGRTNYTAAALDLHEPYIDQPELVAVPQDACLTAGWFWNRNRCNKLADTSDIDGITRIINGKAMEGKDKRADLYRRAMQAFR